MIRIAIFVSGNGTNCENIIRYFQNHHQIKVGLVLSNKSDAYALTRAQRLDVETAVLSKKDFNEESQVLPLLHGHRIDFIVLAGFLLIIPDFLLRAYDHRIINIHPSLLPRHGGKGMYGHHVHEAVKACGDTESGMTVHWVSEVCDGGAIISQYRVGISASDTPDDIAAKEHELEMKYFPGVIEQLVSELFLHGA